MKYFVNGIFRLLYFLTATKGAACRGLYVCYFDFSVRRRATRVRLLYFLIATHAVSYICSISAFPFVNVD